jgi:hypothetical protein
MDLCKACLARGTHFCDCCLARDKFSTGEEPVTIPIKPIETIEPITHNLPEKKLKLNKDHIKQECEVLADILIKKNHDYGNSVQDQFNEYGLTSILIRLDDKLKRLKSLQKKEQLVKEESIIDTLTDIAGYAVLGAICLEIKNEQ